MKRHFFLWLPFLVVLIFSLVLFVSFPQGAFTSLYWKGPLVFVLGLFFVRTLACEHWLAGGAGLKNMLLILGGAFALFLCFALAKLAVFGAASLTTLWGFFVCMMTLSVLAYWLGFLWRRRKLAAGQKCEFEV
ncbi:MAG: hypothetical protein H7A33_08175 [Deltaproteobacteria bacterium]|nr:hypothetical protein [Deltaproteobacteria bacterium]